MELPRKKIRIKFKEKFGKIKNTNTTIMEGVRFRLPNMKIEDAIKYVTKKESNLYVAPSSHSSSVTLKISNIPLNLKRIDILNQIKDLDIPVVSLNMVQGKDDKFKGYAYMNLRDIESAKKVIKVLDRKVIYNQLLTVEIHTPFK